MADCSAIGTVRMRPHQVVHLQAEQLMGEALSVSAALFPKPWHAALFLNLFFRTLELPFELILELTHDLSFELFFEHALELTLELSIELPHELTQLSMNTSLTLSLQHVQPTPEGVFTEVVTGITQRSNICLEC